MLQSRFLDNILAKLNCWIIDRAKMFFEVREISKDIDEFNIFNFVYKKIPLFRLFFAEMVVETSLYPVQVNREITWSFFLQGRRKNWSFDLSNWSTGISKKSFDTIEHLTNYWKAIPDADIKRRYYFGIYYNPDIWIIRIATAWKELNNNYKYSSMIPLKKFAITTYRKIWNSKKPLTTLFEKD